MKIIDDIREISEIFRNYPKEIESTNYEGLTAFITYGSVVSLANATAVTLFSRSVNLTSIGVAFVYLFILIPIYMLTVRRWNGRWTIRISYALFELVILFSIFNGTILDPVSPAFSYMVVLVSSFPLIFDVPWRVLSFITGNSVLFALLSRAVKTPELFHIDCVHLLTAISVSIGLTLIIFSIRMKELKQAIAIKTLSEHDMLTDLMNRRGGEAAINESFKLTQKGTLLFIDVDHFKDVNDTFGHKAGDDVLCLLAQNMKKCFRENDIMIRSGGDEFIVYMPQLTKAEVVEKRITVLEEKVRKMILGEFPGLSVTVSIGAVINDQEVESYEALYRLADSIMYRSKERGRNKHMVVKASDLLAENNRNAGEGQPCDDQEDQETQETQENHKNPL